MPKQYDIYIIEVGSEYRVRPATVAFSRGDPCKVRNVTNKIMVLGFPANLIEDTANPATNEVVTLQGNQKNTTLKIRAGAAAGAYSYFVFTTENGKPVFASGESDPIIIVDD